MAQQCVVHKLAISFSSLISAEKFHSPVCAPVKRFSLSPPCKCRRMKGSNLPFWHIINIQHQCQHHHTFIGYYCFIWFCCFICFFRWFVLKLKPRTSLQVWARRVVKDLWGWAIFVKDHVFCLVSGNDYAKMTFDMGDWNCESECDGDNNVDDLPNQVKLRTGQPFHGVIHARDSRDNACLTWVTFLLHGSSCTSLAFAIIFKLTRVS